jgi:sugar phosphate isomerase/epimerase
MISIAAFPKCYIEDIAEGHMRLEEWIDQSIQLNCDGLEMYNHFLRSHEAAYLKKIRNRVEELGMKIPMMCYSPDFTIPDPAGRVEEVKKQIEMIRVTAELGGSFCRTLSGQARPEVSMREGLDWVTECIEACFTV